MNLTTVKNALEAVDQAKKDWLANLTLPFEEGDCILVNRGGKMTLLRISDIHLRCVTDDFTEWMLGVRGDLVRKDGSEGKWSGVSFEVNPKTNKLVSRRNEKIVVVKASKVKDWLKKNVKVRKDVPTLYA